MSEIKNSSFGILTEFRGAWSATPWLYNSLRWLRFLGNGTSQLCYGFGQTIYALINARFEILASDKLLLTYSDSPTFAYFKEVTPTGTNRRKELEFSLSVQSDIFLHQITGEKFTYKWKLKLNLSPFPDEIKFPYEVPLEFFGHRREIE